MATCAVGANTSSAAPAGPAAATQHGVSTLAKHAISLILLDIFHSLDEFICVGEPKGGWLPLLW
jgi:hypothetical protein